MIVVDTSVIVAILLREPEREDFLAMLQRSARACMSAANAYETAIVLRRRNRVSAVDVIWRLLVRYYIEIIPLDEAQAKLAAAAYDRYGKGINSLAKLNLADCAAYALATSLEAPLLFKGQDFAATDVSQAL